LVVDHNRDEELYAVHATLTQWADRSRVLKSEDSFAVQNTAGDIRQINRGEQGIFHKGTRYLSLFELTVEDALPLVLSSAVRADNVLLTVDLTTPAFTGSDGREVPQDTLHISRERFLTPGICYSRLTFTNYHVEPVSFRFGLRFAADFWDIFEVRGMQRRQRGRLLDPHFEAGCVRISYRGLDDVVRETTVEMTPIPDYTFGDGFESLLVLEPGERRGFDITVVCDARETVAQPDYAAALRAIEQRSTASEPQWAAVSTSNQQFNEWLMRSVADARVLVSQTPQGPYPYAGVPWFSTPFGRDGIITGLELLWLNPDIAAGVLRYLAANQAESEDPRTDAQPGKILHETRLGEMAALDEHPFRRYYGSVDATPLFIMLAGAYFRATADTELLDAIWPNIVAALAWIDEYGDADGDGFVEYARVMPEGLVNQGWKDSSDSVFHADGQLARPPIALAEVQGYVYAARLAVAELAEQRGEPELAGTQRSAARLLASRFDSVFWDDELGTYALALDGEKKPCRVVSSNPGHCLLTSIVPEARAAALADRLLADDMYSGWGIRTLAAGQPRYNPISYHNGSVWPHDNALIAAGLARYDHKHEALKLLTGFFNAATYLDLQRMPELFCGFERRDHHGPTLYPVACLPQAWSAATVFMLLGAVLGLQVVASGNVLQITRPVLPEYLDIVRIERLRVGASEVDLEFHRYPEDIGVNVLRRTGDVDVTIIK
jgi:glycogen debranching enzyme